MIWCRKTKTKVIKTAYQKKGKYPEEPMKTQSKKPKKPNRPKRGKTQATKSWLVWREFYWQSQGRVK